MSAAVDVEVEIDRNEIRRALAQFEGMPGRVSVMYLQEQGVTPTYASYATTPAELDQAVRDIVKADSADEPLGIYVRGTTIREGVTGRGVSDDTVAWIGYKADLDLGKPGGPATWPDLFAAYDRANLPTPTDWQHSGGGFYPNWGLSEPAPHGVDAEALAADIEAELRRAWKDAGYTSGVDSCRDAARVWRLAGSVHRKNRDAPITSTIGKRSGEVYTFAELRSRVPAREQLKAWDGQRTDPRVATAEAFWKTYRDSLADCKARGRDHFRHTFFVAARNAHRMVAIEQLDKVQMDADLLDLVQTFWPGAGFNGDDRQHMHDALNNGTERGGSVGALASPWELTNVRHLPERRLYNAGEYGGGEHDESSTAVEQVVLDAEVISAEEAAELEARAEARMLAERIRHYRVDQKARDLVAAERREPLVVLDSDDFLDAPTPNYLVPKMFYKDGLSVVFGAPGAAKSFLVLDIALSLATGRPWRGRSIGRGRVHYVMAEGQSTNTLRARAWLHHHGVDRSELRGWFRAIPTAVMLTDAGVIDFLPLVEQDKPDMIILDTKNLMFAGKESQGDDYGAMLRVMHRLRAAAGGAAVVLIDHSGLTDDTRTRGSNAQKGGVETEIRVTDDSGLRRAEITRDKSGSTGAEWLYKLEQVDDVPRPPDVDAPAVCVPAERNEALVADSPFRPYEDWNDPTQPTLPDDVVNYEGRGQGALIPLARFMRYSAPEDSIGFSLADARKAVKAKYLDDRGKPKFSDDTIDRAWSGLVKIGRLQVASPTGGAASRSVWLKRPNDPS